MPAKKNTLFASRLFSSASLWLWLTAFGFPLPRAFAQGALRATVDSLVREYIREYPNTSLSIGIYDLGKRNYYYYSGSQASSRPKPDSSSLYEVGGITETFTSILFADLCRKGVMSIDAPLAKYLPVQVSSPVYQPVVCKPSPMPEDPSTFTKEDAFLRIQFTPYTCLPDPSAQPQPVLLCYLSTHTSGLPEYPGNLKKRKHKENPMATYSQEDLYDFLRSYLAEKPVGFDYKHSPLGIALLGHAMSLASHTSFDSLLSEHVLLPMELADTRMLLSENQSSRFLPGHSKKGQAVAHWTYDVFSAAGGLRSSPADMVQFLEYNILRKNDTLSALLAYTHHARLRRNESDGGEEIALGWRISPLAGKQRVVWQSGLTGGFASYIGFVESAHTGIVILSNTAAPVDVLGKALLQKIR